MPWLVARVSSAKRFHPLVDRSAGPSTESVKLVRSKNLDLSEALSSKQSGTLVHVSAVLLAQKDQWNEIKCWSFKNNSAYLLQPLRPARAICQTWPREAGSGSPECATTNRPRSSLVGEKPPRVQFLASLNILLRSPQDVAVLSGPPWWTWRKTATLVGMLLTILVVTLLWVHLLQRRLERQQAAQLAFSRQVLERLEDERRRIAVNLHDSLGQTLLVIKNHAILAIQRPRKNRHCDTAWMKFPAPRPKPLRRCGGLLMACGLISWIAWA